MTISPDTIEKIRAGVDIAELIREYVPTIKRAGRNWKANCPFHNEKTPSFMVSPEKGIFHCFGCGAGGDAFKFVMMIDSLTWPEAIRKLAARCGITVQETHEETVTRTEKQKLYDLLEQAARFYHRVLMTSPAGKRAREYLQERGVSAGSIEKFQLGFAPKGALLAQATKKGHTPESLAAAGLVVKTQRGTFFEYMSDRLVFPILDAQGRVTAFGGRTLTDDQPKYLNSPETAIYSKSNHLYGLFQALPAVRTARALMVLEGYMDVVVTHQFGVGTTVATLGTSLTAQHAQMLSRYADEITLLFDADAAGFAAARRGAEALIDRDAGLYVSSLPDGVDPDEYLIAHGTEAFQALVERNRRSAMMFLIEMAVRAHGTATPEAKVRVVRDLVPVMQRIRNAVMRGEWLKQVAVAVGTTEMAVASELKRHTAPSRAHAPSDEGAGRTAPGIRSAEEELLQLVVADPAFAGKVDEQIFADERCRAVFRDIVRQVPVSDIVGRLSDADGKWFTELALEEKNFVAPEEVLGDLVRDLEQRRRELRRQELAQDVVMMTQGKKPLDEDIVRQYQQLTQQLKGSVKSRHGKKE